MASKFGNKLRYNSWQTHNLALFGWTTQSCAVALVLIPSTYQPLITVAAVVLFVLMHFLNQGNHPWKTCSVTNEEPNQFLNDKALLQFSSKLLSHADFFYFFQWSYQLVVKQNGFSMDESKDSVNWYCKIVYYHSKVSYYFIYNII